jgi:cytoskeletal protein RodZ
MGLDQIGQKLKAAREGQGLSLVQIYERTKIPINHLQSIDNGQSEELPEPVYVAGFIKRYGDCVGLNGQNLSDEYRRENGDLRSSASESSPSHAKIFNQPMLLAPASVRVGIDPKPPNVIKQGVLYSIMIVVVLGMMSFLFWCQSNYRPEQDPTQLLSRKNYNGVFVGVQQTPQPGVLTQPSAVPTEGGHETAAQVPPPDTDASVSITASKVVWVEITAVSTGETVFRGNMERGQRKDVKDPQGVRIRAGDGASVSVETQGKSETLGVPGKVTEKVFLAKTATAQAPASPNLDAKAQTAATLAAKAATVKKAPKRITALEMPTRRRVKAVDGSANGDGGTGKGNFDVPYRYTESSSE